MAIPKKRIKEIFIGGAPRSGTTMLASMIGSHSRVLATPETQFKFDLAQLFTDGSHPAEEIVHLLQQNRRFKIWNFKVTKEKLDVSGVSSFLRSINDQYSESVNKSNYSYWVDSTPDNLRHASFLYKEFPDCLFIHLIRDGRAVYASQRKLDWGSNDPIFAALKWTEAICPGLLTEITFPDRCLRVHYENIVKEPEQECKRICEFIGIEFENNMIEDTAYKVPQYTKAQHKLVGKMPDPTRIKDWMQTLSEKEIRYFESKTYDLLDMLGYERINKGILKKPDEFTQSRIMLQGALKYLTINKWKKMRRFKKNT